MIVTNTVVTITGYNLFQNNTAYNGGALSLAGNSVLEFKVPTMLHLINNHADNKGGAMYVGTILNTCFFQVLTTKLFPLSHGSCKVQGINNTADIAG